MTTTQPQAGSEMTVKDAMRHAFYLGQTYWHQADSEYTSQHKKADETRAKYEALVEETLAILARHAPEALGAAKWQPIETAPKDGIPLLLRSKNNRMADGMWVAVTSDKGYWAWSMVKQEPTHWMPLPQPPAMTAKEQA